MTHPKKYIFWSVRSHPKLVWLKTNKTHRSLRYRDMNHVNELVVVDPWWKYHQYQTTFIAVPDVCVWVSPVCFLNIMDGAKAWKSQVCLLIINSWYRLLGNDW